jgi:hypothetical protein
LLRGAQQLVAYVEMVSSRRSFDPSAFWEERLQCFELAVVGYLGLGLPE